MNHNSSRGLLRNHTSARVPKSATNTNDSNDQISSDSERFVRLDKGRELLNQFWDYRDKNNQLINASAVRDINSSIDAIKDTRWNNDKKSFLQHKLINVIQEFPMVFSRIHNRKPRMLMSLIEELSMQKQTN